MLKDCTMIWCLSNRMSDRNLHFLNIHKCQFRVQTFLMIIMRVGLIKTNENHETQIQFFFAVKVETLSLIVFRVF
jgi:hypothetical protein